MRRRVIKTVLLSVRGVANVFVRREDITPVGVAAEGGLCPTAVRVPFDIGNSRQLGTINNLEALLVTITHNTLELVKLTTGVLLGFGKVSVEQQVRSEERRVGKEDRLR